MIVNDAHFQRAARMTQSKLFLDISTLVKYSPDAELRKPIGIETLRLSSLTSCRW